MKIKYFDWKNQIRNNLIHFINLLIILKPTNETKSPQFDLIYCPKT